MLELRIQIDEQGRMKVTTNMDHDAVVLLCEKVKFLALKKSMEPPSPIVEARAVLPG